MEKKVVKIYTWTVLNQPNLIIFESLCPTPDGIYGGRVLDHPGSFLAITNHGGLLAGLVRLGSEPDDEFFLQPVKNNNPNSTEQDFYHVLYTSTAIKDSKYANTTHRPHEDDHSGNLLGE